MVTRNPSSRSNDLIYQHLLDISIENNQDKRLVRKSIGLDDGGSGKIDSPKIMMQKCRAAVTISSRERSRVPDRPGNAAAANFPGLDGEVEGGTAAVGGTGENTMTTMDSRARLIGSDRGRGFQGSQGSQGKTASLDVQHRSFVRRSSASVRALGEKRGRGKMTGRGGSVSTEPPVAKNTKKSCLRGD